MFINEEKKLKLEIESIKFSNQIFMDLQDDFVYIDFSINNNKYPFLSCVFSFSFNEDGLYNFYIDDTDNIDEDDTEEFSKCKEEMISKCRSLLEEDRYLILINSVLKSIKNEKIFDLDKYSLSKEKSNSNYKSYFLEMENNIIVEVRYFEDFKNIILNSAFFKDDNDYSKLILNFQESDIDPYYYEKSSKFRLKKLF